MKKILALAAAFAAFTTAAAGELKYTLGDFREELGPKIELTLQDEQAGDITPDPDGGGVTWQFAMSLRGRPYEITRVPAREREWKGFIFSATSGAGFALDNGAPILAPIGVHVFGDVDLDLFVLTYGGGADLVIEQGKSPDALFTFFLGARF